MHSSELIVVVYLSFVCLYTCIYLCFVCTGIGSLPVLATFVITCPAYLYYYCRIINTSGDWLIGH